MLARILLIEELYAAAAHLLTTTLSMLNEGGKWDTKLEDYSTLLRLHLMPYLVRTHACPTPGGCAEPSNYRWLIAESQELAFLKCTPTAHVRSLSLWPSAQCWDLHREASWIVSLRAVWSEFQLQPLHCFFSSSLSSALTSTGIPTSLSWNCNPRLRFMPWDPHGMQVTSVWGENTDSSPHFGNAWALIKV